MDAALVLLLGLQAMTKHSWNPQEKGYVPDWAITLITLTVVAAIISLLYGIKKACQFWKERSVGCGCSSLTPYGCQQEATSQHYSVR